MTSRISGVPKGGGRMRQTPWSLRASPARADGSLWPAAHGTGPTTRPGLCRSQTLIQSAGDAWDATAGEWPRARAPCQGINRCPVMETYMDEASAVIADGERLPPEELRPTTADRCLWCAGSLPEGRGRGSPRRFCSDNHRTAFHSAARRLVKLMIDDGRLTVADLHAPRKACTLGPVANSGGGATTLAKTVRSRCMTPIRVLWSGYDEEAGEPAPRTPEAALGTEDSLV